MNNKKRIVVKLNYSKLLLSDDHYSSSCKIIRRIKTNESIIILKEMNFGWYKILDSNNNIGFLNTEHPNILFHDL